jgi:hypothetical protein
VGATGSGYEVRHRHCSTPLQTLADREGGAEATGCPLTPPQVIDQRRPCTAMRVAPSADPHQENQGRTGVQGMSLTVFIPLDLLLVDQLDL